MYFVSKEHERNFKELVLRFHAQQDPEYQTACYVVALPEVWRKIDGDTGEYPFSWVSKFKDEEPPEGYNEDEDENPYSEAFGMLSSGYQKIVLAAANLYNSSMDEFNLMKALGTWGDELFSVFLQAVAIRRGGDTYGSIRAVLDAR
jgi:hypothetical protein